MVMPPMTSRGILTIAIDVCAIVDETGDVVLGHFQELLLKQAFEARKDDHALSGAIVVDHAELDLPVSFFRTAGFKCG